MMLSAITLPETVSLNTHTPTGTSTMDAISYSRVNNYSIPASRIDGYNI